MKTKQYLIFLLAFLLVIACEDSNTSQQDSLADSEKTEGEQGSLTTENGPAVPPNLYTITNDFQEYRDQQMTSATLYLKSLNTEETYIIPPTQYEPVALASFIIDIQVKGACSEVPARAFPVMVGVCQSEQCDFVRPLNMVLKQPAHYNLSGIGGLLTPAVSPVSPCSSEAFDLIETIQPYQEIL